MKTSLLRLLGALLAVAVIATACGSAATDTTAADTTAAQAPADTVAESTDSDLADDDDAEDDHADDDHAADDHAEHAEDGHDHDDLTLLEVAGDAPAPDLAVSFTETDTAGLYDIAVELTNFTITPENVDGDPVDNEGHMHLLIDGVKIERVMDLTHQVQVPEGEHLVELELNANNHATYAIDGEPIRTGETLSGGGESSNVGQNAAADDGHDHDHSNANGPIEDGVAASDATATLTAQYLGGEVTVDGDERLEAMTGDVIAIMVTSDVAEEAHLHGYDIFVDVVPGEAAMILFTADTPGRFEIEFEQSGAFIAELIIS